MRVLTLTLVLTATACVPVNGESGSEPSQQSLGGCAPGTTRGCGCLGGKGSQTCIAGGTWSGCGCTKAVGEDVVVPPAPPPVSQCGGATCAPYTEEDSEVGAKGCCTSSGACGSSSRFLFGDQCIARGGHPGTPNAACPAESGNFIDLEGCCRPDGFCGLSIDAVTNFDLGCVERTQMERLVNDGSGDRDNLSRVFFLPVKKASFPPIRCTP
ncbi:MAG: hypothetical protein JNK82_14395 [Myxococcaceae bacterium]|nr:hypothetical protein [Myxococcaceae bacterium]